MKSCITPKQIKLIGSGTTLAKRRQQKTTVKNKAEQWLDTLGCSTTSCIERKAGTVTVPTLEKLGTKHVHTVKPHSTCLWLLNNDLASLESSVCFACGWVGSATGKSTANALSAVVSSQCQFFLGLTEHNWFHSSNLWGKVPSQSLTQHTEEAIDAHPCHEWGKCKLGN